MTGALVASFLVLGLVRVARHEMWRDEWWVWLIARDSPSIPSLLWNTSYQGHPPLWDLAIYGLTRLTHAPLAMQLFHLGLATAVVFVVVRFAPFTRPEKALFVFGYFPFFEYAVISRNYVLDALFLAVACAVFSPRKTVPPALATSLVLLALSDVLGVILAVALGLAYAVEMAPRLRSRPAGAGRPRALAASAAVALAGIGLSVAASLPPADSGLPPGWAMGLDHRLLGITVPLWRGYVPLPPPAYHFWSANVLDALGDPGERWQAILSVPLAIASVLVVARRPAALMLWLGGAGAMLAFWHVKFSGALRHHGHLFLLLVAACWIAESARPWSRPSATLQALVRLGDRARPRVLAGLLGLHVVAGLFASGMDLVFPFSASPEVARFIATRFPPDTPIVGDRDAPAMAVAGHLGRPLYYPASRRFGTFIVQDTRRRPVSPQDLMAQVAALQGGSGKDVLLVLTYPLDPATEGVELIRRFDDSIVETERYHLYLVRRAS